jgi:hypothetical protein
MLKPKIRIRVAYIYAFCAILSLSVYPRAFDNPFRQDDFVFLRHVENNTLRDALKPLPEFASYRPGAIALFSLEHKLFARNSGAYIMFNYTLHVVVSILMLFILLRIDPHSKAPLLASGLFLMGFGHYGKQIMWACASGPLASVLLSLASMLITIHWVGQCNMRDNGKPGRLKYVLYPVFALILLTLSPLFHEASVVTCVVISFIVMVSLRSSNSSKLNHAILFLIPLPLWLGFWFLVAKSYSAFRGIEESIPNVPVYLIRYIGFMVLPIQRTAIIGATPTRDLAIVISQYLHLVIGSTILVLLLYLAFKSKGTPRVLSVWFLLALGPFTLVTLPEHWLELRYLYHASIPFCGLTAIAVLALWGQKRVVWKVIAGAVIVGVMVGSVVLQVVLENRYDHYAQTTELIVRPPTNTRGVSSCQ